MPFVIGEVLLYRQVLARPAMIEAVRRRLEADGAASYLAEALAPRNQAQRLSNDIANQLGQMERAARGSVSETVAALVEVSPLI